MTPAQFSPQCGDNGLVGEDPSEPDHVPQTFLRIRPAILHDRLFRQRRNNRFDLIRSLLLEYILPNPLADVPVRYRGEVHLRGSAPPCETPPRPPQFPKAWVSESVVRWCRTIAGINSPTESLPENANRQLCAQCVHNGLVGEHLGEAVHSKQVVAIEPAAVYSAVNCAARFSTPR
jgi:hypothetical protein